MTFPDSPRVIYGRNPLNQVICQLRFPPILKIEAEVPADFQERIRQEYPLFNDKQPDEAGIELPPEMAKAMGFGGLQFQSGGKRSYEFSTSDGLWKATLTRDFLALATKKYNTWQDFKRRFEALLSALIAIYNPGYYVRIGLRYQDVIDRIALDLKDLKWNQLLRPHIAGELSSELEPFIKKAARELLIDLHGNLGHVRVKHGIVQDRSDSYVIDADFYTDQRTERDHAISTLDRFNGEAGHLWRWCITDRLHNAMEPRTP